MRCDRNSFWHSLSDGGDVSPDYIMVNRPDMILIPAGDIPARLSKAFNSQLNYCTKGTPSKREKVIKLGKFIIDRTKANWKIKQRYVVAL